MCFLSFACSFLVSFSFSLFLFDMCVCQSFCFLCHLFITFFRPFSVYCLLPSLFILLFSLCSFVCFSVSSSLCQATLPFFPCFFYLCFVNILLTSFVFFVTFHSSYVCFVLPMFFIYFIIFYSSRLVSMYTLHILSFLMIAFRDDCARAGTVYVVCVMPAVTANLKTRRASSGARGIWARRSPCRSRRDRH